jgi:hypothetical protein
VIFALAIAVLGLVLFFIVKKPPYILAEDKGYIQWNTTEIYKLRTDLIHTYLRTTMGTLLTSQSGNYDLTGIGFLVKPLIVDKYSQMAKETADVRLRTGQRQLFSILDVRRYYDPQLPQYLVIAVRGEKATYGGDEKDTTMGVAKVQSNNILYMVYLEQVLPTPDNPWGLYMVGIKEVDNPKQAADLWQQCVDLVNTTDLQGNTIQQGKPVK